MKKRALVSLASLALLTACAVPKSNYSPTSVAVSEPPLNTISTSQVGDPILSQGRYKEADAIYLEHTTSARWAYTLYPGYYVKQGDDDSGEYFLPGGGTEVGRVEKAVLADPWKSVMTRKSDGVLCVVTIFNVAACGDDKSFDRRKVTIYGHDSFQQTLIYNGRVGKKINIGYREFSNNMARPAFNNEVEYDLSESPTIGYKGAQLEVLEATNQFIRYRVIKNFKPTAY
ncbi:hypothetical protein [Burkholderia cepacia]|uniref:hypothetical protein n=1 Tax=Burkholderia cepacia TaxID=292 RepID=UPI001588E720|nr:hypothetical protein [Burkholderia cepacia]